MTVERRGIGFVRTLAIIVGLAAVLVTAQAARAFHTHFVALNCNTNNPQPTSTFTRNGSPRRMAAALRQRSSWSSRPAPRLNCCCRWAMKS